MKFFHQIGDFGSRSPSFDSDKEEKNSSIDSDSCDEQNYEKTDDNLLKFKCYSLQDINNKLPKAPKDPKIGSAAGISVKLLTNAFKVHVNLNTINLYDVLFEPPITKKNDAARIQLLSIEEQLKNTKIIHQ